MSSLAEQIALVGDSMRTVGEQIREAAANATKYNSKLENASAEESEHLLAQFNYWSKKDLQLGEALKLLHVKEERLQNQLQSAALNLQPGTYIRYACHRRRRHYCHVFSFSVASTRIVLFHFQLSAFYFIGCYSSETSTRHISSTMR